MSMGDNYPEGKDSICPVCRNPMERGYIVSNRGIYWNDHIPRFICQGEAMGPHADSLWNCAYVEAYRCRRCRVIRYLYYDRESRTVRLRCPSCGVWNDYAKKEHEDDIRICQTCAKEF